MCLAWLTETHFTFIINNKGRQTVPHSSKAWSCKWAAWKKKTDWKDDLNSSQLISVFLSTTWSMVHLHSCRLCFLILTVFLPSLSPLHLPLYLIFLLCPSLLLDLSLLVWPLSTLSLLSLSPPLSPLSSSSSPRVFPWARAAARRSSTAPPSPRWAPRPWHHASCCGSSWCGSSSRSRSGGSSRGSRPPSTHKAPPPRPRPSMSACRPVYRPPPRCPWRCSR